MCACQKSINHGLRFKFSYNACQWRTIVMQFGFLHSPLATFIAKKLDHFFKWLLRSGELKGMFLMG